MSDTTTRIRIDIAGLTPEQAQRALEAVNYGLRLHAAEYDHPQYVFSGEVGVAEKLRAATVTLRDMATESQIEEARALPEVGDDLEVDDDAEVSLGAADGYFIGAWLWVPGGERTVTLERLRVLTESGGMPFPTDLPDDSASTDAYLKHALAHVHAEFGAEANIGDADLDDALEAYATQQEEQA